MSDSLSLSVSLHLYLSSHMSVSLSISLFLFLPLSSHLCLFFATLEGKVGQWPWTLGYVSVFCAG